MGLRVVTVGYKGLQRVLRDNKRIPPVTSG